MFLSFIPLTRRSSPAPVMKQAAMPIAVAAMSMLCIWRLYHLCIVTVEPDCVAVVYSTRRRCVWHTSIDAEMTVNDTHDGSFETSKPRRTLPDTERMGAVDDMSSDVEYEALLDSSVSTRYDHRQPQKQRRLIDEMKLHDHDNTFDRDNNVNPLNGASWRARAPRRAGWLSRLWHAGVSPWTAAAATTPRQQHTIVKPPSSLFGVFVLPRAVFSRRGNLFSCAVAHVAVTDGSLNIWLTLRYRIPFDQLERYLAANGPHAPHAAMTECVDDVTRTHAGRASVGNLLSHSRRQAVFMPDFTRHLYTRLMSETVVCVLEVRVENVELADSS